MEALFAPRTVAVIGASENEASIGRTLLWNLMSNPFGGAIYPVNPRRDNVLGIHAYDSVADVPAAIDLAVIATPAATVPGIVEECIAADVKGAVIISSGFSAESETGRALKVQLREQALRSQMRIIGPDSLGIMGPFIGINATVAKGLARPGNIGFISESGAMSTAVLDWSFQDNVGFSAFVGVGEMVDVGWGDLIYYLGEDERTKAIVIYMETIGDARAFLSAAREVSLQKPIIIMKAGRIDPLARPVPREELASFSGLLVTGDAALDAALRRSGVLRVDRLAEMFAMAEVLAKQPRPTGSHLTIVTNAGGPAMVATDALLKMGGALTPLTEETLRALEAKLAGQFSGRNPIDIHSTASPDRYGDAVEIALQDRNSDGLLVILSPQNVTRPTQTAEKLVQLTEQSQTKPLLTCWMGGPRVSAGMNLLNRANIPTFPYPDTAARVFNYMWQHARSLESIYEMPSLPATSEGEQEAHLRVGRMIDEARLSGRTLLTEYESKEVFKAYGLPVVQTRLAPAISDAVAAATEIGYPVAVKLNSEDRTQKSAVGGVQLNARTSNEVRTAYEAIQASVTEKLGADAFQGVTIQPMVSLGGYELIIGSSYDEHFGPILLFGAGGIMVETFHDLALALPPLNTTLARRMMEQTKIYRALRGYGGRQPIDLDVLAGMLIHFSHLVVEQKWIKEIDINPLVAAGSELMILDARIALHGPDVQEADLTPPAIRPYPEQYVESFTMRTGQEVLIRPVRPEDEPLMGAFNRTLSPHSIYLRYFHPVSPQHLTSHGKLAGMCFIDYDREMTLVAESQLPNGGSEIVGMGQLRRLIGINDAEFAILISDAYQRTGLGTKLLTRLLDIGLEEGVDKVMAEILPENEGMRRVCKKLGFSVRKIPGERIFYAEIGMEKWREIRNQESKNEK
ncbi:MAG: bifunctional acetate--CoA ligase family protein/GNAT family N-acetyltransferase [Caldilineaceae bacterium]|nr:bifunctional acetate--CoA ligase family protein/GNAT family N-acetyltransferase [Caldilineaceae bacterium]